MDKLMLKPKHYVKKKVDRINPLAINLLCTFSNDFTTTNARFPNVCQKKPVFKRNLVEIIMKTLHVFQDSKETCRVCVFS